MNEIKKSYFNNLEPKSWFLLDGLGALLSVFLLGVVLVKLESIVGMPKHTLYFLAGIPCVFALYDLVCYKLADKNWRTLLRIIAIGNLVYCFISIGLLIRHFHLLTNLGLIYFILEILVLIILVYLELKYASSHNKEND